MSQGLASTRMASGALAPEWVDDLGRPPGGVMSIDEFDGGSLDAVWTTLTLTGSQVITVDNSLFSVRPTGLINVQDANSILQAHTLAIGDAVEIAVVGVFNDDARSFNFGPVVSDGVVAASNCMTAFIQWTQSGFVWTYTTSATATLMA